MQSDNYGKDYLNSCILQQIGRIFAYFGWLFALDSFLIITDVAKIFQSMYLKLVRHFRQKMGWAWYVWGIFYKLIWSPC
jgi:hypothetical protein